MGIDEEFSTYYQYDQVSGEIRTRTRLDYEALLELGLTQLRGAVVVFDSDGARTLPITIEVTNVVEQPMQYQEYPYVGRTINRDAEVPSVVHSMNIYNIDSAAVVVEYQIESVSGTILSNVEQFFSSSWDPVQERLSVVLIDSDLALTGSNDPMHIRVTPLIRTADGTTVVSAVTSMTLVLRVLCRRGYIANGAGNCIACPAGTRDFAAQSCRNCDTDEYNPVPAQL